MSHNNENDNLILIPTSNLEQEVAKTLNLINHLNNELTRCGEIDETDNYYGEYYTRELNYAKGYLKALNWTTGNTSPPKLKTFEDYEAEMLKEMSK